MKLSSLVLLLLLASTAAIVRSQEPEEDDEKHWPEQEMDTAWLTFDAPNDTTAADYAIYFVSDNCYKCAPIKVFHGNETRRLKVSSQFPWMITLTNSRTIHADPAPIVDSTPFSFQEYGHYRLTFKPGQTSAKMSIDTLSPGRLSFIPMIVAISVCVTLAIVYKLVLVLIQRRRATNNPDEEPLIAPPKHHVKPRLISLDAFRGIALFFMVFVNYGGGGYWYFSHSTWNGITVADLLFPWFVWIMGAAMPFAFSASEKKKQSKLVQFVGLFRRSVTLFALGMFLNDGHFINYWRIPGVLQRFAVAYLAIGTMYMFVPKLGMNKKEKPLLAVESEGSAMDLNLNADFDTINRGSTENLESKTARLPSCFVDHFSDLFPYVFEYALVALLVMVWFLLTFLLRVPGCPTGYLGPGGLSGNPKCTGGAAGYIDRMILGNRHIYDNPTCRDPGPGDIPSNYLCQAYDPEGLLGNLTSIFLCFLGLQAGRIMKTYQTHRARFIRLVIHGLVWAAVGTGLCGASQNNGVLPLNKNLWSFSFTALLGGLAFLLLAVCFLLIDWIRIWKGAPFTYVGMNSIVVYMGHEILEEYFPFSWSWKAPHTKSGEYSSHWMMTASNLLGASWWALIAFILFKKKIFIRV